MYELAPFLIGLALFALFMWANSQPPEFYQNINAKFADAARTTQERAAESGIDLEGPLSDFFNRVTGDTVNAPVGNGSVGP